VTLSGIQTPAAGNREEPHAEPGSTHGIFQRTEKVAEGGKKLLALLRPANESEPNDVVPDIEPK
jgi:hypothetical protein